MIVKLETVVELLGPHAQNQESLRAFSVVTENWNAASDDDRARTLPFIFATSKLFENASGNGKALWIDTNGKSGKFTFASIITDPE
jgi:hypothetical protein